MTNKAPEPVKRHRVAITFPEQGRTKQQFREECNINNIMKRYEKTGVLKHVNLREPQYGLVPATDFAEAMRIVTDAQETFNSLPSELRKRVGHSPEEFLRFYANSENAAELESYGLHSVSPAEPEPAPSAPADTPEPAEPTES